MELGSLAYLLAQTAAKAAGGMAMRSSTPLVKRLIKQARPTPKVIKRFEVWQESRIIEAQEKAVAKFLASRECEGLLATAFATELAERLTPVRRRTGTGQLRAVGTGRRHDPDQRQDHAGEQCLH
ncbi:hypothetical protein [Qaidamihabitans albus]|uniref:hypothetical protein n=1 Tax=Qaidamihabitans albus TaxID=2795733 RepID=UPI0018F19947|nr:hypothetical protein [Qaidamihabitans albus]